MIALENFSKKFKNEIIFEDVTVSFRRGSITGIIGRNGSGKTVLLKCICGLMLPDSGKITVNGQRIGTDAEVPQKTGVLIEAPSFDLSMSGYKNLVYLYGLNRHAAKNSKKENIADSLQAVDLSDVANKKVKHYSLGMKQRLGLAQAIMEKPDLLILDEPLSGLDITGVSDMRSMLIKMKNKGVTIVMATHNVEDIKVMCDYVYRIVDKKLIPEPYFS
jgi:ABC-2 type transport system ATP-binding protein